MATPSLNYVGTTAAYENGDGTGLTASTGPSMLHAWIIIVGSLGILWFLAMGPFRGVTQ
jgi:hypothetical protein